MLGYLRVPGAGTSEPDLSPADMKQLREVTQQQIRVKGATLAFVGAVLYFSAFYVDLQDEQRPGQRQTIWPGSYDSWLRTQACSYSWEREQAKKNDCNLYTYVKPPFYQFVLEDPMTILFIFLRQHRQPHCTVHL